MIQLYVIALKQSPDDNAAATKLSEFQAYNTYKFHSYYAALAYARSHNFNPIDFEIRLLEFSTKLISKHEIDYSTSTLAIAVEKED
jgi:hypothetical protein